MEYVNKLNVADDPDYKLLDNILMACAKTEKVRARVCVHTTSRRFPNIVLILIAVGHGPAVRLDR